MKAAIIFGGSGFIGTFFAVKLLEESKYKKVYIVDKENIEEKSCHFRDNLFMKYKDYICFINHDVRDEIKFDLDDEIGLIANFAAIHREPGHEDHEYFETNLHGAKNICAWAEKISCKKVLFTSSISPYGLSEEARDETSLTVPVSAYGSSKLASEEIHKTWHAKSNDRRLIIVRPGVVFGPSEGGNVSRLIKAVLGRYFFYMGNRETRKAGIYVKELTNAMYWVMFDEKANSQSMIIFNGTMNPGPSIEEYVDVVCKVAKVNRYVPNLPHFILLYASHLISFFMSPFGINHPFSPVRINKLVRSNNIIPSYLLEKKYNYKFTLFEAFEDWKESYPEEW